MSSARPSGDPVRQLLGWMGDREYQLQMALDAAELGVWHLNAFTGELVMSDRCKELVMADPVPTSTLKRALERTHPADRARFSAAVEAALRTGERYSVEFRVAMPDGTMRWLHCFGGVLPAQGLGATQQLSGVVRDVTMHHAATTTVARQREELRQLMQAAPVGIAKFDRNARFVAVNQYFIDDLGIGDVPVIGMCPRDVFSQSSPPHWGELFARCMTGATLSGDDERFVRADGGVEPIRWHAFPWFDESDEIAGVVLLIENLRAQRLLEEQGRLWASAFSNNAYGMAIVDTNAGTIRTANAAYAQLLGYAPEELVGRQILDLYAPEDHGALGQAAETAHAGGSASRDTSQIHKNGMLIPVTFNIVCVRNADGMVTHCIETIIDRRDQERALAKLRHQEAQRQVDLRFRLFAESAAIGITLWDVSSTLTYANPTWLGITAITLGQALTMDTMETVHPDDFERVKQAWRRKEEGAPVDLEFRYRRPSGEIRWVHEHVTTINDAAGIRIGFVCTTLDITDRLAERAVADRFHSQIRALSDRWQKLREVERIELAGTLRDGTYRGLTELKLELEALAQRAAAAPELHEQTAGLVTQAEALLNKLRRMLFELTPPGIAELGFNGALERIVSEQSAQSGVPVSLTLPASVAHVPQDILLVMYAVAKEALANALRHASATRIEVGFEIANGLARLRVSDDGVGIEEKDRNKAGCFGLLAASERMIHLGGTLRTLGIAGRGTTLEASVSIRRDARRS